MLKYQSCVPLISEPLMEYKLLNLDQRGSVTIHLRFRLIIFQVPVGHASCSSSKTRKTHYFVIVHVISVANTDELKICTKCWFVVTSRGDSVQDQY